MTQSSLPPALSRREFVGTVLATGAGTSWPRGFSPGVGANAAVHDAATPAASQAGSPAPRRGIKLGFDHFSLRAHGWKAPALIDYAASLKTDAVFLSELNVFERRDDAYLRELKSRADGHGLQVYVGMFSICPTSGTFDAKAGTAVEQLRDGIRIAKAMGSPVIRAVLGRFDDRNTHGGIETHIKNTVDVCKAVRAEAQAAGVKIAIENHAGDMQAWELAGLVEAAGPDFVGVNLDPGNATWTIEDPVASLETLAPYVLCTSIRDSAIWEIPKGASVQWTAVGEGDVDFATWTTIFAERCKGVPVFIETISGLVRPFNYLEPEFWKPWPKARAHDFARFLQVAKRGKPRPPAPQPPPAERRAADQAQQKIEVDKSLAYCREKLGLGVKA
jgi:3-oxoisoapionate decarboxylase